MADGSQNLYANSDLPCSAIRSTRRGDSFCDDSSPVHFVSGWALALLLGTSIIRSCFGGWR